MPGYFYGSGLLTAHCGLAIDQGQYLIAGITASIAVIFAWRGFVLDRRRK